MGVADNGTVAGITNRRDNTRSENFTYDSLNRIFTAQTQTTGVTIPNPNCWGLTFGYDAWGNLLSASTTGPSGCSEPLPLNATANASNRVVSNTVAGQTSNYCYDAAGNLLFITSSGASCPTSGPYQYSYNAENQLTSASGFTYTYDGKGRRVEKSNGKLYWYGMSSDPLDETDSAGNTNNSSFNEYVFFNGKRIARRDYQNNVDYYFADHLGTARVVTNSSGAILDDSDFYPFGGERPVASSSRNNYKFTGKERDPESGLDDFGARYYSSAIGRFMTPDWSALPAPVPYAELGNPQTLNLYSYVSNNPLTGIDPDGHMGAASYLVPFLKGPVSEDWSNLDIYSYLAMQEIDQNDPNAAAEAENNGGDLPTPAPGTQNAPGQNAPPQQASAQNQTQREDQKPGQVVFDQVKKEFPNITFDQNNVQVLGAHNGHENIVVTGTGSKEQLAQFQKTLKENKGLFGPGSRIDIKIGKGTFTLHVEGVSVTSSNLRFQSHVDRGNPNRDVVGFFTHVFVDGLRGAMFHPRDAGLDPSQ